MEYNNNSNNDDDNNNYGLNFGKNNNFNKKTRYEYSDENHILIEISLSIWCMLKLNRIIYKENELNKILDLVDIGFSSGKIILINLVTMKIHQELMAHNNSIFFSSI